MQWNGHVYVGKRVTLYVVKIVSYMLAETYITHFYMSLMLENHSGLMHAEKGYILLENGHNFMVRKVLLKCDSRLEDSRLFFHQKVDHFERISWRSVHEIAFITLRL